MSDVEVLDRHELERAIRWGSTLIRRNWGKDWGRAGCYGVRNVADTKFVAVSFDLEALKLLVPGATVLDVEW